MKKLILISALLIASPAHAVGFGMALGGYGAAQGDDWQERLREAREEQMERQALFEQQQQTRIMQEQLNEQRQRQYQYQPTANYYR